MADREASKDMDKEMDVKVPSDGSDIETASIGSETQAGVKKVEAISKSWTKGGLIIAYVTYVCFYSSSLGCRK